MQLVNHALISVIARVRTERGQDLLEYAMLGGLIAAAITVIFGILIGTGGVSPINDFANGVKDCIDFDQATACTGGL